jgi:hypothetical protein
MKMIESTQSKTRAVKEPLNGVLSACSNQRAVLSQHQIPDHWSATASATRPDNVARAVPEAARPRTLA